MPGSRKLPISLVVITMNEEQNLSRCLKAADFCSEIVVVDSGSTDGTLRLAAEFGARIVHQPWLGYRDQKQFACEQATQPWILCIDADEVVSPELHRAIATAFQSEPVVEGFDINRRGMYGQRPIKHSGWHPQWRTFLFRREYGRWEGHNPHPYVAFAGPSKRRLGGDLYHFTCRDIRQHVLKNISLAQAAAAEMHANHKQATARMLLFNPLWATFRTYVLQRGFLDGYAGFAIAIATGFHTFMKYAILREMASETRHPSEQRGS